MIFGSLHRKLDQILNQLDGISRRLLHQGERTMAALDDLAVQIKANTDAESSAVTLIQSLADQFHQAATDPVKVAALAAQLKSSADALAAAIVANTPAA